MAPQSGTVRLHHARAALVASLDGLADLPRATYATNLGRFFAFLAEQGHDPATLTTDRLDGDVLEAFYLWLVRRYGGAAPTALGRLAAARAFLRFLDRRGWLAPGLRAFRIDAFAVPEAARREFEAAMRRNLAFLVTVPGYSRHVVFEKTGSSSTFNIVTIAVWESREALDNAGTQVRAYYQSIGFDLPAELSRWGVRAELGNYSAPRTLQ